MTLNLQELEKSCPSVRSNLADICAWSIAEKILTFKEMTEFLESATAELSGQTQHPIFLLTLQRMLKTLEDDWDALKTIFDSVQGLDIKDFVPESLRSDEKLVDLLEEYQLSFLMPLLSVQQDLSKQLKSDPGNPGALSKWIHDHVEDSFYTQPGFIISLFQVRTNLFHNATSKAIFCYYLAKFHDFTL